MKKIIPSLIFLSLVLTPFAQGQGRVLYSVSDPLSSLDDGWARNVANAGDVNGDGVNDLIVAAPREPTSSQAGRVNVLSGTDGSLLYSFAGSSPMERYGAIISGAGDLNSDGFDDFLIGRDNGSEVDFFSGFDGGLLFQITGLSQSNAAAPCGDWNGDSYDDIVISGASSSTNASSTGISWNGWARVYSGLDGSLLTEFEGDLDQGRLGYELAVGDIDGDGTNDILLSNYGWDSSTGIIKAFSGATGSVMFTKEGVSDFDRFGISIDLLDVNGDGSLDIAVAASGTDYATSDGSVYIYDGATHALLNRFDSPGSNTSYSIGTVINAGDANGDGYDDYMIGMSGASNGPPYSTGAVYVIHGQGHYSLAEVFGTVSRSQFGYSMARLGDIDADGIEDYVIGSPAQNESLVGEIYVISSTVNQAPVAVDDFYTVEQDEPTLLDVTVNDTDPENDILSVTIASQPSNGSVVVVGSEIEYSPNPLFVGTDTFTYNVFDPTGESSQATVTIDVNEIIRLSIAPLSPGNSTTVRVARFEPSSWFYLCYSLAGGGPTTLGNYQGANFTLQLSAPIKTRPPIILNSLGESIFSLPVPSTLPSGTVIWSQGVALDIAGGTGITVSNALELTVL